MIAHKNKPGFVPLDKREETIKHLLEDNRRANTKFVLTIGRELDAAHKQLCRNGDGAFNGWCRDKLKLKRTTAWKWVTVYHYFGDCSLCEQYYQVSALYLLARPSTASSVRKVARRFAEKGGIVEAWRVKLWIEQEKQEQRPNLKPDEEDDLDPTPPKKSKKPPSALNVLKRAWKRATKDEKQAFRVWANARYKKKRRKKTLLTQT